MSKASRIRFKAGLAQVLDALVSKYPAAFFPKDSADTKPLKIGIFRDIMSNNPPGSAFLVGHTLRWYTGKTRYLEAMVRDAARVDLAGEAVGDVSAAHRSEAAAKLATRLRAHA